MATCYIERPLETPVENPEPAPRRQFDLLLQMGLFLEIYADEKPRFPATQKVVLKVRVETENAPTAFATIELRVLPNPTIRTLG